jgi:hypothetical protein
VDLNTEGRRRGEDSGKGGGVRRKKRNRNKIGKG